MKKYTKKQIKEAINYWTNKLNMMNESYGKRLKIKTVFDFLCYMDVQRGRAKHKELAVLDLNEHNCKYFNADYSSYTNGKLTLCFTRIEDAPDSTYISDLEKLEKFLEDNNVKTSDILEVSDAGNGHIVDIQSSDDAVFVYVR